LRPFSQGMKTDSLFYRLFQIRPQLLFELVSGSGEPASRYEFRSVEVKQLAFRIDGLFLPINGESSEPFYVVEVQFQPDEQLYYRLFAELFLYLRQYQPSHPWQIVVIYPTRSVERTPEVHFGELLNLASVTRIYLDELEETENSPLGTRLMKLIVANEREVPQRAQALLNQTIQQLVQPSRQQDIIELIESIVVYKFPQLSRQEIAAMLGVEDLRQTRFYQEVFAEGKQEGRQEGKLEAVSRMLASGVDVETIAQWLDLPLDVVRKQANNPRSRSQDD